MSTTIIINKYKPKHRRRSMGRPLNKRNFGNPANPGTQIEVECNLTGTPTTGWIVRQRSNVEYEVSDGVDTVRCKLVDVITGPAQFRVVAENDLAESFSVRSLHARRVKTFDVQDKPWSYEPATADRFNITGS